MSKILVNEIEPSTPGASVDIYGFRLLEILLGGISYKGEWVTDTPYLLDDAVVYSGAVYKCNTPHTSGVTFDTPNWTVIPALV